MLASSLAILSIFHEEGLWEAMFSEHFFYLEMEVFSIERSQETIQDEVTPGLLNFTQNYESMDSEPLRLEVISFVELAATATGSLDNGVRVPSTKSLHACVSYVSVTLCRKCKNLSMNLLSCGNFLHDFMFAWIARMLCVDEDP